MSVPQFHEHVRQQTDAIWQAIYTHPFVQEVGRGVLARPAFEFFIRQDYLYLKEFARVLCLGGAKADNLETLAMFTEHAATVVQVERTFHSNFAVQLGLTVAALEATPAAPVTRAYTRHLLAVAHSTLGETVARSTPVTDILGLGNASVGVPNDHLPPGFRHTPPPLGRMSNNCSRLLTVLLCRRQSRNANT
jgi:thiaminase/transcriptional activator TenA